MKDAVTLMKAACLGLLLVIVSFLTTGCGGGYSDKKLILADIGWTENTAFAHLSKVLLEEQLGYQKVEVKTTDLDSVYDGVAKGNLDAFQDVWLPYQRHLLQSVQNDVEQLSLTYQGQGKQGIAVPSYMDITSLDQLNQSPADLIFGIEPSSVVMRTVYDEVIPAYGLRQKLVQAPTLAMLAEVENHYHDGEEIALIAWSPHWMNQRYALRYLEDPKDAFGELDDPASITTIVNKELPKNDPVATGFLDALILDEEQLNDLESRIDEVGDPHEGAKRWAEDNSEVWQPWIEAAKGALK
jgi:glycine betaine/proline transport system substrate-binding protein